VFKKARKAKHTNRVEKKSKKKKRPGCTKQQRDVAAGFYSGESLKMMLGKKRSEPQRLLFFEKERKSYGGSIAGTVVPVWEKI